MVSNREELKNRSNESAKLQTHTQSDGVQKDDPSNNEELEAKPAFACEPQVLNISKRDA